MSLRQMLDRFERTIHDFHSLDGESLLSGMMGEKAREAQRVAMLLAIQLKEQMLSLYDRPEPEDDGYRANVPEPWRKQRAEDEKKQLERKF